VKKQIVFALFVVAAQLGTARANAPGEINYQGKLTDAQGNPLTGTQTLKFEIFNNSAGTGNALYTDTQSNVTVTNGLFNVVIGGGALPNAINPQTFAGGKDFWLRVTVGGTVLQPLQKLAATPFALNVASDSVGTGEIQDGTVGAADLAVSAVGNAALAPGAVTDAKVADVNAAKVTSGAFPGTYDLTINNALSFVADPTRAITRPPRVIHTSDPVSSLPAQGGGCPKINRTNPLISQTITLTKTADIFLQASIIGIPLSGVSRIDAALSLNGQAKRNALGYGPSGNWVPLTVLYSTTLGPGTHTLSLDAITVPQVTQGNYGCGAGWGSIDTVIFE
jgi:hypothetical protein